MGRTGKTDLLLMRAPLAEMLREAADPHMERGKSVVFAVSGGPTQPLVQRKPEVIHGLRNLIQNAVDFSRATVWVDAEWGARTLTIRVVDDGAGYPAHILGRIGDPFVTRRQSPRQTEERPEYEGMGLGLFIAKTLLERSGAELSFANGAGPGSSPARCGAIVEVIWPLAEIAAPQSGILGENTPIEA
jgi:two-component system sensor histidine kinase RegB